MLGGSDGGEMGSVDTHAAGGRLRDPTLSEFLIARLEEDEAVTRACLEADDPELLSPTMRQALTAALEACRARQRLVLEHVAAGHKDCRCATLRMLAAGLGYDGGDLRGRRD